MFDPSRFGIKALLQVNGVFAGGYETEFAVRFG
jgi:hypothetical protein